MMKYYLEFLIFGCLCNSLAGTKNQFSTILNTTSTKPLLYDLLVTLLKQCDLNSKKVIVFDNTQSTFSAVVDLQPQVTALLFSSPWALEQLHRYQFDDLELDVIILVIRPQFSRKIMEFFFTAWRYNRNCIVYIFPIPLEHCDKAFSLLERIMRYYFVAVYVICLKNNRYVSVYTHDPYGDTKPSHWVKVHQVRIWSKDWNFYEKRLDTKKTEITKLCTGFNFNRIDPSNSVTVLTSILPDQILEPLSEVKAFYDAEIENKLTSPADKEVEYLKRLLKLQFEYYPVSIRHYTYEKYGIDIEICSHGLMQEMDAIHFFHPVEYESFAIMSHDRGLMTPLEKIAKFYGIWTLTSLTVMLSIIFIVIWFITKKISSAFFDVIRLLINSGIIVPIDTRPRKIFFSMMFLYFMVIHATFSGHLAEFLTKVEHRQNIESIEELKDPGIKRIYNFGYQYDDNEEFDILRQKSNYVDNWYEFKQVINETDHAYIAPLILLDFIWDGFKSNSTLHISKNTFGLSLMSASYRPGFPLSEKFNWAFMYLFERQLISSVYKELRHDVVTAMAKQAAAKEVHHRPITVSDLYFAFVLLIGGNSIAFICFLVEISLKIVCKKLDKTNRGIVRIQIQPY